MQKVVNIVRWFVHSKRIRLANVHFYRTELHSVSALQSLPIPDPRPPGIEPTTPRVSTTLTWCVALLAMGDTQQRELNLSNWIKLMNEC